MSCISTAPWLNTVICFEIMRMKAMSCSTTISAFERLMSRMMAAVRSVSSWFMPAAGSSSRIRSGSPASTVPISTHWRWPCAKVPTVWAARPAMPTRPSTSFTMASARCGLFLRRAASQRFSRTERSGTMPSALRSSVQKPIPAAMAARGSLGAKA